MSVASSFINVREMLEGKRAQRNRLCSAEFPKQLASVIYHPPLSELRPGSFPELGWNSCSGSIGGTCHLVGCPSFSPFPLLSPPLLSLSPVRTTAHPVENLCTTFHSTMGPLHPQIQRTVDRKEFVFSTRVWESVVANVRIVLLTRD